MELIGEFESYSEWAIWKESNSDAIAAFDALDFEATVLRDGVAKSIFGPVPPKQIAIRSKNYRESIIIRKLNSRQRALLEILAERFALWNNINASIYAAEAVTPFALFMRGRFPKFIGSEYTDDPTRKKELFPIAVEDLNALSFQDQSFDCAITNDVLEHVPDIQAALSELRRILKTDGILISTFPFTDKKASTPKAKLVAGKIVHLTEPEYHGNPVDPNGSLVFTVPGWDVLEMAKQAGFKHAKIIKFASIPRAIRGSKSPFIDVFWAEA